MNKTKYYIKITSKRHLFDFNFKELVRYRDLVFLFVKRNFISKYKQTILGPAWAIIQPLMTTVVFTFVFGNVAGLANCGAVPKFLFYMVGNISWEFFAGCLNDTAGTFLNNTHIMTKVYFPRLVMPISTVISQFINLAIQGSMLIVFLVIYMFIPGYNIEVTPFIFIAPLLLIQTAVLGMGCGIIISACTVKYRDLRFVVGFGVSLWMYGTPVAYSMDAFEKQSLIWLIQLNPMTSVIETMRYALLGPQAGTFDLTYYLISWLFTLAVLAAGVLLFNKVERTFADTI